MVDLRKHVYESAGIFDFEDFFSYSGNKDHGASALITSRQALTIPNVDDYEGPHMSTQQIMAEVIYGLPDPCANIQSLDFNESNRLKNQAIRMSLICERGQKMIIIDFPKVITSEQINLLQAYQNTYGTIVDEISRKYVQKSEYNSPIVVFFDGNDDNCSHSFKNAIEYAKTLSRIEKLDTPNEMIIGSVINPDNQTLSKCNPLRSLLEFTKSACKRGIGIRDCQAALDYIRHIIIHNRGIDK